MFGFSGYRTGRSGENKESERKEGKG